MAAGGCLCGAVRFAVDGPVGAVAVCHCSQCRRWSGHVWGGSLVAAEDLRLTRDAGLRWYRSSATAARGFCADCGASLFWKAEGEGHVSVAAGAFDPPTGLTTGKHIFTADAGDYYAPDGPPPPPGPAPERLDCRCLCGAVAFALPGPAGTVTACHCGQCRRLSGHYAASFDADESALAWQNRDGLAEYGTPAGGRRGFCAGCGSSLYFRAADGAFSVEAGAVRGPTGGTLSAHIFVADKGDWYALNDGVPQAAGAGDG